MGFRQLRAVQPFIVDGVWQVTDRPGFGIEWNEDAIARYTVARSRLEVE